MQYEVRIVGVDTNLMAAHGETLLILQVEQRHLVSCVVTVVQRHFPVGRTIQLSSTTDEGDNATSLLEDIQRFELWPVQVTGSSNVFLSRPNVEKISSYIIFTQSVEGIIVQTEMLYASNSWDIRGLF